MKTLALIAAGLVAFSATARADEGIEETGPVYLPGGQYGAVLDQSAGRWQLLPLDAADQDVANGCAQQLYLPSGVWLVNRDAHGRAELVAPSGTALPPGHRERVALVACEAAGKQPQALRAPAALVDWLTEHTGAIWVDE
ncbi:MAG: hypothetical protein U1F26_14350 [Lysobacterales bacterium]